MLYLDPEFSGEVVVSWIVLVAVEIILMFIVLFLSVCRCTSRNGEANIGVVLTVSFEVKKKFSALSYGIVMNNVQIIVMVIPQV